MEIAIERKRGAAGERMHPGHVFEAGDLVRFRFRSNSPGYLYVLNRNTSGNYVLLFPKTETGSQNAIEPETEYLIPATGGGWFQIGGPSGQDVVYWMVSEADLTGAPRLRVPSRDAFPSGLVPRCDLAIIRARGDCVDLTAGIRAGTDRLVVDGNEEGSVVSSPGPLAGPVVYEFRVAHR